MSQDAPQDDEDVQITTKTIKLVSGQFDMESVRMLNFSSFGTITKMQNLKECKNLEILDLSHNMITQIEGLEMLLLLKKINLSDNMIESLQGLENLKQLEILILQNNKVEALQELEPLKQLPRLRELNMKGNPVTQDANYFLFVTASAKKLILLDGAHVLLQMPNIAEKPSVALQGEIVYEKGGDWLSISNSCTSNNHSMLDTSRFESHLADGNKLLARADSLLESLQLN